MNVQIFKNDHKLPYRHRVEEIHSLWPNAKKKGDRWVNGNTKIWLDKDLNIVVDYGK